MICFRCGSQVEDKATQCGNCGQDLGTPRKVTRTIASFKAIELRRQRAADGQGERPFGVGDWIDDRYVILDLVGTGPLGLVYRAREQETGLDVALKAIHPTLLPTPQATQEFVDAFRRLGGHDAPDVLRVVPVRAQDRVLARSRFISGLSLRKVLDLRKSQGQRFEPHEVGPRIFQLVRALEQLHRTSHHGFLKPNNIILEPNGVRITDLGLFHALPHRQFVDAQRDAGAYPYLAPEVRGESLVDARADVFTVGALLYELLSGQPKTDEAPPLAEIAALEDGGRWRQVDSLIAQAMAPQPGERFASISEFGDAFAVALEAQMLIDDKLDGGGDTRVRAAVENGMASIPILDAQAVEVTDSHVPLAVDVVEVTDESVELHEDSLIVDRSDASFDEVTDSAIVSIENMVGNAFGSVNGDDDGEDPASGASLSFSDDELYDESSPTKVEAEEIIVALEPEPEKRESTLSVSVNRPPWFLRSTGGFLVAAFTIIALVGAMVLYYIQHKREEAKSQQQTIAVHVPPKADKASDRSTSETTSGKSTAKSLTEEKTDTAVEKAAAEKAAVEKAAGEKAAAEKAAAEKEAAEKAAAEKAAADKAAAEKAAAEKAAAEKAAAEKAAAEKEAEEKAAAEKAAAEKAAADKAAAEVAAKKQADAERKKLEAREKAEERRLAAEKKSEERRLAAAAKAEKKRIAAEERAERKRIAAEKKAEKKRLAEEKRAREKAERQARAAERKAKKEEEKRARDEARAKRAAEKEEKRRAAAEKKEAELAAARAKARDAEANQLASGILACPRGMRLIRTARFPKKAIKLGKIVTAEGIALARSGKAYCIDTHEYPGAGSRPRVNVTFNGAQALCAKAGKRLCTDREWSTGCYGRGGGRYPYGKTFKGGHCNTETADGSEGTLKATGRYKRCRSAWGLYDMSGNVAEWTASKRVRGGDYASDEDDAACSAGGGRSPGTSRGNIGFRCCKGFTD
ncbi:MAG: protein kinase domain-containing protein [Bradymonadia bacterium]